MLSSETTLLAKAEICIFQLSNADAEELSSTCCYVMLLDLAEKGCAAHHMKAFTSSPAPLYVFTAHRKCDVKVGLQIWFKLQERKRLAKADAVY